MRSHGRSVLGMLCSAAVTQARRTGRFAPCLTLVTILACAGSTPVLAQGQPQFVWASSAFQYDTGALPSVAASGTTVIEVHQADASGDVGPLYYHTGQIQPNGTVKWASSALQYDTGALPSVAVSGTSIIEVHQADASGEVGPLYYHTGQIQPNGTVTWGSSAFQYDTGAQPSVALAGSTILEVHQGDGGALYYHTAEVQSTGTVTWASGAFQYDNGFAPRVALSGPTIVEVHQSVDNAVGPLYYHTGGIQANGTATWASSAFKFDTGATPQIALAGSRMIDVHQADSGVGPLWYHTGSF
jgi:hypothetical protein